MSADQAWNLCKILVFFPSDFRHQFSVHWKIQDRDRCCTADRWTVTLRLTGQERSTCDKWGPRHLSPCCRSSRSVISIHCLQTCISSVLFISDASCRCFILCSTLPIGTQSQNADLSVQRTILWKLTFPSYRLSLRCIPIHVLLIYCESCFNCFY